MPPKLRIKALKTNKILQENGVMKRTSSSLSSSHLQRIYSNQKRRGRLKGYSKTLRPSLAQEAQDNAEVISKNPSKDFLL